MICETVLAAQPRHFHALHLLGVIAVRERRFDDAIALLRQALVVDPRSEDVHYIMGRALGEIGQPDAAVASYDEALALQPRHAQAHFHRAMALKKLARPDAALDSYDRAIAIQPDYAGAHFNRGNLLCELNQLQAAVASYDLAISHRATFASAYCNRGIALDKLGRRESALASYDRAIAINPRDAGAFYNRGVALKELNRLDDSLTSYDQAIAIDPRFASAWCNRGVVLKDLNRWDAALESFDQAIALDESLAEAYCNKGNALAVLGQAEAAIGNYDKAIALRSDFSKALFSRATAWLLAGDFARGWPAYEARWRKDSGAGALERRAFHAPPWLGEQSIAGHTILLYGEQGLGDTVQFCRYATLVADLGARVILEVPHSLTTILASMEGVSQVAAHGEAPTGVDHHCPLMSLPLAFKTTLADIPAPRRYIHSPPDRGQFWREKVAPSDGRLKVGLVWSGGTRPDQPEAWPALSRRDIPLAMLADLRHPDIDFFSLQLGQPATAELARLAADDWDGPAIIDHTSFVTDFSDTASFIDNLDLVITVDTSVAHVAGALGKSVWILNRFDACWRWLLHREDSPWYPSARLYRQRTPGDWDSVIRRVRSDLFGLLT